MENSRKDKARVDVSNAGISPWKLIQTYDDKDWEEFIAEWSEGFDPPYEQIVVLGGAGDKGRDVVAYIGNPTDPNVQWDSYQCKHYRNPLTPTNIYVELAKLCVYTQRGDYTVPRRYRFVSPRGVGTKLHDLLKKPDVLRTELISNWKKYGSTDFLGGWIEKADKLITNGVVLATRFHRRVQHVRSRIVSWDGT